MKPDVHHSQAPDLADWSNKTLNAVMAKNDKNKHDREIIHVEKSVNENFRYKDLFIILFTELSEIGKGNSFNIELMMKVSWLIWVGVCMLHAGMNGLFLIIIA